MAHVEIHRKLALRRRLLALSLPGPVYVPFCGDGDIAGEVYTDRLMIGCDLDPERVATVTERLPDGRWFQGDADKNPLASFLEDAGDIGEPFAVADLDSYADPYPSYRDFMDHAPKAPRLVIFFTDGHRQGIVRGKTLIDPTGQHRKLSDLESRELYNYYWPRVVEPWLMKDLAERGYTLDRSDFYVRGSSMLYFGIVITDSTVPNVAPIKNAGPTTATNVREGRGPTIPRYNPLHPYKLNQARRERFLSLIADGKTVTAASKAIGVNRFTIDRALLDSHGFVPPENMDPAVVDDMTLCDKCGRQKDHEDHMDFSGAFELAQLDATDEIEYSLYEAGKAGNVTAQQVWLYNRNPARWTDRRSSRVEMSGPGGGPVPIDDDVDGIRAKLAARLNALAAAAEADALSGDADPEGDH